MGNGKWEMEPKWSKKQNKWQTMNDTPEPIFFTRNNIISRKDFFKRRPPTLFGGPLLFSTSERIEQIDRKRYQENQWYAEQHQIKQ